jgi:large subunit ribosomal protein L22
MSGYSYPTGEAENIAKAIGREMHISPKHSMEVCRMIRGKKLEKAKEMLEGVIAKTRAVPFKRHHRCMGHRKGKGFGPGRYPVKAAGAILKIIESAEANAEYSGLDTESLVIRHISAYKGRTISGWMPRAHGRSSPKDTETVNIEVILEEVES